MMNELVRINVGGLGEICMKLSDTRLIEFGDSRIIDDCNDAMLHCVVEPSSDVRLMPGRCCSLPLA